MYPTSNDVLVSCGYDGQINVYDMRRSAIMQQHEQPHPLSTICLSPCGTYCAVGNVQGEVYSFDFRNLKEPLGMRCVHDHAVVRVAFISAETADVSSTSTDATNATNATNVDHSGARSRDSISSTGSAATADMGSDVLSPCHFKTPNTRRDSWASLLDIRGNNGTFNDSRTGRLSLGLDASRRQSFGLTTSGIGVSTVDVRDSVAQQPPLTARRDSFARAPQLSNINEVQSPVVQPNEPKLTEIQPSQPNSASVPWTSSTAQERVADYELAARRTAKLAEVFETMRIKRKAKEICSKSMAYAALEGMGDRQQKYLMFIEELLSVGRNKPVDEVLRLDDLIERGMVRARDLMREMFKPPKENNNNEIGCEPLHELCKYVQGNNNNNQNA